MHAANMAMRFGPKILMLEENRVSIPQKKVQCFQPRDCHSQVLCLKSRIYLNLKLKFNLKIILLLVSSKYFTAISPS